MSKLPLRTSHLQLSYGRRLCKVDEHPDFTLVTGLVMVPDKFDNQGDVASADVIERAAHGFMEEHGRPAIMHKTRLTKREAAIVESQIIRSENYSINGTRVPIGSWLVTMKVYETNLRSAIRRGIFQGFSIGADADFQVVETA